MLPQLNGIFRRMNANTFTLLLLSKEKGGFVIIKIHNIVLHIRRGLSSLLSFFQCSSLLVFMKVTLNSVSITATNSATKICARFEIFKIRMVCSYLTLSRN